MYTIGLLNKVGESTGKYLSQVSSRWAILPSQVWKFWLHKQAGVAKYNSKFHFVDNFCFNFIKRICRFTWNGWTFHSHTSTPTYLWLSLSSSTWNIIKANPFIINWVWTDDFFNRVTLADTYSTDYYDTSYPGLIMKVDTKYSIQTSHDKYSHLIVWLASFTLPQ